MSYKITNMKRMINILFLSTLLNACSENKPINNGFSADMDPVKTNLWLVYSKESTNFSLWSPAAREVRLHLYQKGDGGTPLETHLLEAGQNGLWHLGLDGDLQGTYYTYQIKIEGNWLEEYPGVYAQAVGVNGKRAMIIDLNMTNPEGWAADKGPEIKHTNEAIIYELHIRDMTIHPQSVSSMPGKYLGLVE